MILVHIEPWSSFHKSSQSSCIGSPTSPSSICVPTSLPVLAGMKSGVAGLSRKASVWQSMSEVTVTSLNSSRKCSENKQITYLLLAISEIEVWKAWGVLPVWTSACVLPRTASGVRHRNCSLACFWKALRLLPGCLSVSAGADLSLFQGSMTIRV